MPNKEQLQERLNTLLAHGSHDQQSHGNWADSSTEFLPQNAQREFTPDPPDTNEYGEEIPLPPVHVPPDYREQSEKWIASLTPEEQKAAADYTGSYLYDRINTAAVTDTPDPTVDALDRALAKAPIRDTPIRVYRRASFKDVEQYLQSIKPGDVIPLAQPGAFQSTSITPRYPIITGFPTTSVLFEINTRSGAAIGNVTQGGGTQRELEVLLPRNARYKIVSVQHNVQFGNPPKNRGLGDDYKRTVVQVEEVFPNDE